MTERRLTPKQKRVLEFIERYTETHGYAPTQQEIAQRFGFRSLGTVQNYLVRLQQHGWIRRSWNAKRALEVIPPEPRGLHIPLLGYVAAGRPIEAIASNDALEVPPSMVRGENFVLRVKGESMVDEGILDGDYIVVRKQVTGVHNGQTVVALVDGEATVKRFYRTEDRVELRPANSTMEPILVRPDQSFRIEGVVVGVIRRCE